MVEFDDIIFSTGRHKRRGLLHFDPSSPSAAMEFRPKATAAASKPPVRLNPSEIVESWWAQVHDGYQWRLHLRGMQLKLIGFPERAINELQTLMNNCGKEIQKEKYSTVGKNGGEFNITESNISFLVDGDPAFELPISAVSQSVVQGRNEVAIELAQDENPNAAAGESLCEIRVFVPEEALAADDEDNEGEEEEEKPTPAQLFSDRIMALGNIGEKGAPKSLASFSDLFLVVPRAKYDVDLNATFMKLHNKTFSYRINYKQISKMFLFDNLDLSQHFFVIGLNPPVRQGRTTYPYIVIRFDSQEFIEQQFQIDEQTSEQKYQGLIKPVMKGATYDVVTRVFKAITGKKVLVPGNSFQSRSGSAAVRCSHRANDGHLFMLEKSFFFLHKPPLHIRHQAIQSIEFDRVSAGGSGKTFDLKILADEGGKTTEFVFNGLARDEYDRLFAFLKSRNLSLVTSVDEPSRADRAKMREDMDDPYLNQLDQQAGEFEDSEDDEDFTSGSDSDSSSSSGSASGSEIDSEVDSQEEEEEKPAKAKGKKKTENKEKSKKEKGTKGPKRASSAFIQFSNAKREEVKRELGGNPTIQDVARELGVRWKAMSEEEKAPFVELQKADQERFERERAEGVEHERPAKKRKTADKDPREPKKPQTPYFLFQAAVRGKFKAEHPGMSMGEMSKALAEQWKTMSEEDRQEYVEQNRLEKLRYKREMEEWAKENPKQNKKNKKEEKVKKEENAEEEQEQEEEEAEAEAEADEGNDSDAVKKEEDMEE